MIILVLCDGNGVGVIRSGCLDSGAEILFVERLACGSFSDRMEVKYISLEMRLMMKDEISTRSEYKMYSMYQE